MNINLWETESGRVPVQLFIKDQDPKAAQRIMKDIRHLGNEGLNLLRNPNRMKKLRGYKDLYELKTYSMSTYYRIIFTVIGEEVWLLEAFKKKSDSTPVRYINKAINRRNLLQGR